VNKEVAHVFAFFNSMGAAKISISQPEAQQLLHSQLVVKNMLLYGT
jgi:hypothetical protein